MIDPATRTDLLKIIVDLERRLAALERRMARVQTRPVGE